MDLNTIWFVLVGVLLAVYAVLDGFDLGVGVMHLFSRSEEERRIGMAAIGPVWDGNEVWLLAGGGAIFAAFPGVYAATFSGFYLAFMLLLAALIFRAVSMEFRGQVESPGWKRLWDMAFGLGSLAPALLYGVALGNVLRGLPVDADGIIHMPFASLLNPYALLIGGLSLALFVMHGATFLAARTEGHLCARAARWAGGAWFAVVLLYIGATVFTIIVAPFLVEGVWGKPLFWPVVAALVAGIVGVPVALRSRTYVRAFLFSALTIAALLGLAGVGLFPRMVPSSIDPAFSLTVYNASSTPLTHKVMLIIALVGLPVVVVYTAFIYKVFMGKINLGDEHY